MDNQMMLNMLMNMLDKMSDEELESNLVRIKGMVGPKDYEKIVAIINERKRQK